MKALIIGATGATGKDLVTTLSEDPGYTEVKLFVRRPTGIVHPKITEIITDFDNPESVSAQINADVLFCCLGTTLKAAGSKEKQRHIDLEIPVKFAGLARANGVHKLVLLSAYGASVKSRVFYSRLKGELEERMDRLAFDAYIIFRPGLLLRKNTDRVGEKIMGKILNLLNGVGILKRFKPLPTLLLAEKMAKAGKTHDAGKKLVELEKIFV